jgi:hypothetical protein
MIHVKALICNSHNFRFATIRSIIYNIIVGTLKDNYLGSNIIKGLVELIIFTKI